MDMKDLVKAFPKHSMVGGRMIVHHEGKNVEIGLTPSDTGVFTLTPEGRDLFDTVTTGKKPKPRVRRNPIETQDEPDVVEFSPPEPEAADGSVTIVADAPVEQNSGELGPGDANAEVNPGA